MNNPHVHQAGEFAIKNVLESPPVVEPFNFYDSPPVSDGACAMDFLG